MEKFTKSLNPKSILLWYSIALLISILGTYLAYNEPFGSEAWQTWSPAGKNAWIKDSIRGTAITLVSLFILWNLNVFAPWRADPRKCYPIFRIAFYEKVIIITFLTLLLTLQFSYLRLDFIDNLPSKGYPSITVQPEMYSFKKITLPYFPYSLYSIGLYIGIMLPALLCLIRRISFDKKIISKAKKDLEHLSRIDSSSVESFTIIQFKQYELAFQNYVILLKNFSERYLPLILSTAIFLIIEQISSSKDTATQAAIEITKILEWLLIGPTLIIFLISVAIGYQITVNGTEQKLRSFIDLIKMSPGKSEMLGEISNFREKLIWSYSPLSFIVSAVKSASIAIPLLLTLTIYVMQTIMTESNWLYIVLPKAIAQFLKSLY
ncbi:MAG: hypothetical protein P8X85_03210 [Desulfobacterales bacterium]